MTVIYTTGTWKPNQGREKEFVEEWAGLAGWASGMAGAGTLRLARDIRDADVFVSLGEWESIDAVRAWKAAREFRGRMARVLQHVAAFEPTELAVVAMARGGTASVEPVPLTDVALAAHTK
jgi:heme-degrading monooxygenase HmoA